MPNLEHHKDQSSILPNIFDLELPLKNCKDQRGVTDISDLEHHTNQQYFINSVSNSQNSTDHYSKNEGEKLDNDVEAIINQHKADQTDLVIDLGHIAE